MFVRRKGVFKYFILIWSAKKGAANEAYNAGSKAAEHIVDEKLKEAENVSIQQYFIVHAASSQ